MKKDFEPEVVESVSIVFLMTVSGTSVRQMKRLLRQIYRPHHYYLIHVDQTSEARLNFIHHPLPRALI